MKILKKFHNTTFDTKFVYQTKELQLLIRADSNNGHLKNMNVEADLSEKLFSIAKHKGELWNKFLNKFCEKAKLAKNDLTEVSLTTEQNREGRYSLLIKMGDRGYKIVQLLGDSLENAINNYVEDKEYELKPLKEKMAPPPPAEDAAPAATGEAKPAEGKPEEGKAEGDEKAEQKQEAPKKEAKAEKGDK